MPHAVDTNLDGDDKMGVSSQPGKYITDIKGLLYGLLKPFCIFIVRIFKVEGAFIGNLDPVAINNTDIGERIRVFRFQQFKVCF